MWFQLFRSRVVSSPIERRFSHNFKIFYLYFFGIQKGWVCTIWAQFLLFLFYFRNRRIREIKSSKWTYIPKIEYLWKLRRVGRIVWTERHVTGSAGRARFSRQNLSHSMHILLHILCVLSEPHSISYAGNITSKPYSGKFQKSTLLVSS